MNFVLLVVIMIVLWLWVRGHPLGILGMLAALVCTLGPAAHPDWSWTNPDDVKRIALFVGVALAPFAIKMALRAYVAWLLNPARAERMLDVAMGRIVPTRSPNLFGGAIVAAGLMAYLAYANLNHGW